MSDTFTGETYNTLCGDAEDYLSQGSPEQARELLQKAISLIATRPRARSLLADACMTMELWTEAREQLEILITLDEDNIENHFRLAQVLEELGEYQLAADNYQVVLDHDPKHHQAGVAIKRIASRNQGTGLNLAEVFSSQSEDDQIDTDAEEPEALEVLEPDADEELSEGSPSEEDGPEMREGMQIYPDVPSDEIFATSDDESDDDEDDDVDALLKNIGLAGGRSGEDEEEDVSKLLENIGVSTPATLEEAFAEPDEEEPPEEEVPKKKVVSLDEIFGTSEGPEELAETPEESEVSDEESAVAPEEPEVAQEGITPLEDIFQEEGFEEVSDDKFAEATGESEVSDDKLAEATGESEVSEEEMTEEVFEEEEAEEEVQEFPAGFADRPRRTLEEIFRSEPDEKTEMEEVSDEELAEAPVESEVSDDKLAEATGASEVSDEELAEAPVESEVSDEELAEAPVESEVSEEELAEVPEESEVAEEEFAEAPEEPEVSEEELAEVPEESEVAEEEFAEAPEEPEVAEEEFAEVSEEPEIVQEEKEEAEEAAEEETLQEVFQEGTEEEPAEAPVEGIEEVVLGQEGTYSILPWSPESGLLTVNLESGSVEIPLEMLAVREDTLQTEELQNDMVKLSGQGTFLLNCGPREPLRLEIRDDMVIRRDSVIMATGEVRLELLDIPGNDSLFVAKDTGSETVILRAREPVRLILLGQNNRVFLVRTSSILATESGITLSPPEGGLTRISGSGRVYLME